MKPYGLWYNIHAKRKRIKNGSNERMRKPGSKGAPTDSDFKNASEEFENIMERGKDSKGHYRSTEDGAGLTQKGAKAMGVKTAVTTPPSKLDPNGKAAKRRKSFCARMSGMEGPMKDEKGRPTRKAMSLKRWNCNEELEEGMLDGIKKSKVFHKKEYSQALNILKDVLNRKGKTKPLYYAAQVSRSFPHVDPKELIKMIQEGKVTVHFKKDGFGDKETYKSEDEARKSIKILKDEGFKITKVIGSKKLEEEDMTQQNPLQGKIDTLLRSGFVDKTEVAVARRAIQKLNSDETLTPDERSLIQRVFKKLLDIVTKKDSIFGSVRKSLSVQEEEELNELSPKTLVSYVKKRGAKFSGKPKESEGMFRAVKKMNKHHVDEESMDESFKVGDNVHVGHAVKGGAGYKGKVKKIEGEHVFITPHGSEKDKFGGRMIRGHIKNTTMDESFDLAEGRPSQRHALDGHDYHKKPDHHLRHIMKDAGEAAKNAQGMGDSKGEGKYRDQVNDAATVLHFRKQNGMPAWFRKKYGHDGVKEELVKEVAKWRKNPDAHDYDTDGSYMPKGGIKSDPLEIRQGASKTQNQKDPKSMAGKFGAKYAKKYGVPTKLLMKNIPLKMEELDLSDSTPDELIEGLLDIANSVKE